MAHHHLHRLALRLGRHGSFADAPSQQRAGDGAGSKQQCAPLYLTRSLIVHLLRFGLSLPRRVVLRAVDSTVTVRPACRRGSRLAQLIAGPVARLRMDPMRRSCSNSLPMAAAVSAISRPSNASTSSSERMPTNRRSSSMIGSRRTPVSRIFFVTSNRLSVTPTVCSALRTNWSTVASRASSPSAIVQVQVPIGNDAKRGHPACIGDYQRSYRLFGIHTGRLGHRRRGLDGSNRRLRELR